MITVEKKPKLTVPPAFNERCVLRCLEKSFGPSSKGKPMITTKWELCGYFGDDGKLKQEMQRGNTIYKLAGLSCFKWFTLTAAALPFYIEFYNLANPENPIKEGDAFDDSNPNLDFFEDLAMQVILSGTSDVMRKKLTDEEKTKLQEEGKPAIGDPILDDEGNEIETPRLNIGKWLKKYTGEIDPF